MPVAHSFHHALAAPRSQCRFHLFLQNHFDHFPHPLPYRRLQPLPQRSLLALFHCNASLRHGVFLLCPEPPLKRFRDFSFNYFSGEYAFLFFYRNRDRTSPTATRPCPNSSPPPASSAARSRHATASLLAPRSRPSRRTSPSTRKSCASIRPLPALHPPPCSASTCVSAAMISASVCFPLDMPPPFFRWNDTYFCAVFGENVRSSTLPSLLGLGSRQRHLICTQKSNSKAVPPVLLLLTGLVCNIPLQTQERTHL